LFVRAPDVAFTALADIPQLSKNNCKALSDPQSFTRLVSFDNGDALQTLMQGTGSYPDARRSTCSTTGMPIVEVATKNFR
jgi:hypothetical protein